MADYYNAPEEDYDRLNRQVVVLPSQFFVSRLTTIGIRCRRFRYMGGTHSLRGGC